MIITRAPLRVSFFGGGTDFPEYFKHYSGAVLASAIEHYSYVTASTFPSGLFDHSVRLSYSKSELSRSIDDLQHPVFRECLRYCGLTRDIELHTVADLPSFTGLGSSSSFTVALLNALHCYKGEYRTPLELAYEAIHIERNLLKETVGFQDQTTAAVGGFNVIEFRSESEIRVRPVILNAGRLEELHQHLFLVFTGIKRRAAEIEAQKVTNFSAKRDVLGRMRAMVDEGYNLLTGGASLEKFGDLLHEAWESKRSLSSAVSNPQIESMYDRGRKAGAWGGKLLGAGGGGFLLFCGSPEALNRLRIEFSDSYHVQLKLGAAGSQVLFAKNP